MAVTESYEELSGPAVWLGPQATGTTRHRSFAVKRAFDVAVSLVLLVLLSPLFAYAAFRVRRGSPGPVLFRQRRLGMHMREFTMLKFRTMYVDADDTPHRAYIEATMNGHSTTNGRGVFKLERRDAVTPFGRRLRRTSLDELPQLVNVLRGEMSLVGPRPCIPYEIEHFDEHHFERFLVPAGMTGLWQVTARARATYREAVELDVIYARTFSLRLDACILARTPLQFLNIDGTE